MKQWKLSLVLVFMLSALSACNKADTGAGGDTPAATADAAPAAASGTCNFASTKDNAPFVIKAVDTDTPEAKEFLATCNNPYTKKYLADAEAAKVGRKVYTYNGCSGCHGGKLEGIMAPALTKGGGQGAFDTKWVYAKNETDKGMFETISAGSPGTSGGVMMAWNKAVAGHVGDGLSNDDILKVIAYIRTEYKGDGEKPWMN